MKKKYVYLNYVYLNYVYLNVVGLLLSFFAFSSVAQTAEHHKEGLSKTMRDHSSHNEIQTNTLKVDILPSKEIKKGEPLSIKIRLTSLQDNTAIRLSDLKEVHTKKIHVLLFDETLNDYQHVHPEPTKQPGVYQFDWTPKNDGGYRLWVDVVPLKTEQEEYIRADLTSADKESKPADKILSLTEKRDENLYALSFDSAILKKGQATMGVIKVVDAAGQDFNALEPIMGAYAHIVAINEDFETIAHVHPMGEEPSKDNERGGPLLKFHFDPEKAGFYKIWLQVQIEGKDVYIPFGINVFK